jgi:hypothetical protein
MARKWIAGGLVVAALVAGLVGVSAYALAVDHAAGVPANGRTAVDPANPAADKNGAAADLNNWQEARVTVAGSRFR